MTVREWREWMARSRLSLAASIVVLSLGLMAMAVAITQWAGIYGQAQAFVWISLSMLLVWLAIDSWVAREYAFSFFFLMLSIERVYMAFDSVLYPPLIDEGVVWGSRIGVLIFLLLCGVSMRITLGRMVYRARLLQVLRSRRDEEVQRWRQGYSPRVTDDADMVRSVHDAADDMDG